MTTKYRVQVKIPSTSNLPKDTVTNTFYFLSLGGAQATEITEIHNRLIAAYAAIDERMSPLMSRTANAVTALFYDMDDAEPRLPKDTKTLTLAAATSAVAMPSEVALVLSFNTLLTSGVNLQRRRGRVYLGPWNADQNGQRPNAGGLIPAVINFASALEAQINVAVPINWAMYSPTDNVFRTLVNSWVDNEWDIQRRRGTAPTTRQSNVVTPNF